MKVDTVIPRAESFVLCTHFVAVLLTNSKHRNYNETPIKHIESAFRHFSGLLCIVVTIC